MYLANRSLSQRARHLLIPARGHLRWVGGEGATQREGPRSPAPRPGSATPGPRPASRGRSLGAQTPTHTVLGRSLHRPRLRPLPGSSAAPPASGPRTPRRLWQFLYLLCLAFFSLAPRGWGENPRCPSSSHRGAGRTAFLPGVQASCHACSLPGSSLSVCLPVSLCLSD